MFNLWTNIKAWFKNSWSILIARLEVLTGFLIGVFGAIDWAALTTLDFKDGIANMNTAIVASLFIIKGIVSEMGRRAGTVENTASTLVPTSIVSKAEITVK